ncbi:YeiH family protein [Gimibacter soli]|uniref:Sulfate exporter family transporter n=1 Tax=Gimibacter soli TaxID=3024400 RepID=A0AAE9XSN0_9PROT|nr:putative sulfate exporter family transporter [Gimibacter soli]WCL53300.1 putative sulfate exporter family transporter [Gimibacter soli]
MKDPNQSDLDYQGDLFCEQQLAAEIDPHRDLRPLWKRLFPGLAVCAAGAASAAWLSDHYGFPVILLGLLVGLAMNFVSSDQRTHEGLDFASRSFLRVGIAMLGLQVTFMQIGALGIMPFVCLLAVMAVTVLAGVGSARLAGQSGFAGLLAGGATAICGSSAALALYGVIGKDRLPQAQFALTLVGVAMASALAFSIYPILAAELGLNDMQAGFLLGASIHDVAQAIGGGYSFSDEAGQHATIVKMARVALLAPFVALISLAVDTPDNNTGGILKRLSLPWFIVAFLLLVGLNSLVNFPRELSAWALTGSKVLLLFAVTATAMRTRLDLLLSMGWRPAVPVFVATSVSFCASLLVSWLAL